MTIPLVPPVAPNPAEGLVLIVPRWTSKDMMQPDDPDGHHPAVVLALLVTPTKIQSAVPFLISVIGDAVAAAVVRVGPWAGVPIVPLLLIGTRHSVGYAFVVLFPPMT
jgi:hypothetical protein